MSLLRESLEKNGIVMEEQVIEKLEIYQAMLMDWNTRMDLTSVRDGDMASRHFVDSLLPMKTEGLIP
ncbi:MAG: 16S rRNA (guanine(527)-N(7))-methyltransferase RsmG, partial [Clostridiales bacterium]|nr:16S rRNA (guanine(527)-N(7))-methyltransferase RsmG [Clostridiales bacterium]